MKWFMKDSRGYTLIEVVIVIAIMAVIAGSTVSLVGVIPSYQVNQAKKEFVSALNKTRVNSTSFKNVTLELAKTDSGVTATLKNNGTVAGDAIELGGKDMVVKYTIQGEAGATTLNTSDTIVFSFSRTSGSLKKLVINNASTEKVCTQVEFIQGSKSRVVEIEPLTGKVK